MGIFAEQTLVFIVLMLCIIFFSDTIHQYYSPGTLDTENIYAVDFTNQFNRSDQKEMREKLNQVVEKIKSYPMVVTTSKTLEITPYLNTTNNKMKDSLLINGRKILTYPKYSDKEGFDVYKPHLEEGTWLDNNQLEDGSYPTVITRQLAHKIGWSEALGKQIQYQTRKFTVVGIISGMKNLPLEESLPILIMPEITEESIFREHTIRIKPGEDKAFMNSYYKEFRKMFPDQNISPLIAKMNNWKLSHLFETLISFASFVIPTFFLLIFAFIGTFGLFWMLSRKRRREYALRMALGSTKHRLMRFVIQEGFIITLFSTLPGIVLFFLVFDPNPLKFISLGTTLIIMFLFSITSVWLPAYQVSKINPAETLHYE